MTPTLRNSSRSTRGTTRNTAYSNTCLAGILRFLNKGGRSRQAGFQKPDVGGPLLGGRGWGGYGSQPVVGHQAHYGLNEAKAKTGVGFGIGRRQLAGLGQQHVVLHLGESPRLAGLLPARPGVVHVQGRAVV